MDASAGPVPAPDPDTLQDRPALRRRLIGERRALPDREARVERLGEVLVAWLAGRSETVIGAYWPIRGEPDLLRVLGAWLAADAGRLVGLPFIDPETSRLRFRAWHPAAPMREDAFGIPTPDGTPEIVPQLLLVPCVGFGFGRYRLGYGGGFYDRTLAAPGTRPFTVGVAFASAFVPDLRPAAHDVPLDLVLTEDGPA